jgi:hypothetical protein
LKEQPSLYRNLKVGFKRNSSGYFWNSGNDLIDIIANAPAKVNAFISTIIEIAQHYNLT